MIPRDTSAFGARRYRTRLRCHLGRPSCVALIDLSFLLLFFILMASSVVRLSGIRVNLPRVKAPSVTGLGRMIVTITAPPEPGLQCKIYFRDQQLSFEELRQKLSEWRDNIRQTVIIRADREVPAGVLDEVMGIVEEARMNSFIATQLPDVKPETRFE